MSPSRPVGPGRDEHRVARITGLGIAHPLAIGHEQFWQALNRPVDTPPPTSFEAFDPSPWFGRNEARRLDPYVHYAVAAADLALTDAGARDHDPERTGVVMGNLYGAGSAIDTQRSVMAAEGRAAVSATLCAVSCEDACASQLAIRFGARGPCKLVVLSCASGTAAIGEAAELIASGRCDTVLAGATLGPVPEVIKASYENARVASTSGWERPFDRRRDGFVFTEGAAVVVLESAAGAEARGAAGYADVIGWATTNDAFHLSKPSGEGIEAAMRQAIEHAGLRPADICHIDAHATGTTAGDLTEADAIGRLFGDHRPSVASIKGVTGHSLAASGAFEVVGMALSMHHRTLVPTARELELDPAIDADVIAGAPRAFPPGPVLVNSFGLGGQNASVVLRPPSVGATG